MTHTPETALPFETAIGAVLPNDILSPPPEEQPTSLVFIDGAIEDIGSLTQGLTASTVVVLDEALNGMSAIAETLAQYNNLESIHIFSHGATGALALGNTVLSSDTLTAYATDLGRWGDALSPTGDVLLYGCNVAAGPEGTAFVDTLSDLIGADIAASSDLTGYLGDWTLEVTTGTIEADIALDAAAQATFGSTLALLNNGGFEAGLNDWFGFSGQETVSTTEAFTGTSSLSLLNADAGTSQNISGAAGETYSLTGFAKSSSTGYSAIGVTFFDANFGFLATAASDTITSPDWQQYQVEATAPTGTAFVQTWTYRGTNDGEIFIDDLTLNTESPPPGPDTTAPSATIGSATVTTAGANGYEFTVTYGDNVAIDVSTIGDTDVQVTGPNGFSQVATLVNLDTNTDGTPRTARYRINAPGGTWDDGDNGTYSVSLLANEVTDTSNNAAAPTAVTFEVDIATPGSNDELLLNGSFESSLNNWFGFSGQESVSTAETFVGASSLQLSVADSGTSQNVSAEAGKTYSLSGYAKSSSSGYSGIGMSFFDQNFNFLTSVSADPIDSANWQLYEVEATAPTGTAFVQAFTYKGTNDGNVFIDGLSLTTPTLPPTADTTPPTASINTASITTAGANIYEFSVTYADNLAIDVSTLDDTDIRVTGPNGFNQLATLVSVNNNTDGTPRTAIYRITAPGGSWAEADNGAYTVALLADQVTDTNNNAAAIVSTGFDVNISGQPGGGDELLLNGSFESTLTNWVGFTGQEQVSTTDTFVGAASLELSTADSGTSQNINATPGETYTLKGFAKSSSSDYSAFGMMFFDANFGFLGRVESGVINTPGWQPYQVEETAPAGTAFVQVWTYKGTNSGKTNIDGLSLTAGTAPPTNVAPEITSNGGGNTATINLDEGTTLVTDVQITDANGDTEGNGITYSINDGDDQALFTIDVNTGVLSFIAPPDFEAPGDADTNNVYFVNVLARDSGGLTDSQFMAIVVGDVVEAGTPPVITSNGGGDTAIVNVNEGSTLVTDFTVTDADGDTEGNGLTYSINDGVDRALFSIAPDTGVLSFEIAPDFETPLDADGNNVYEANILVTDSTGRADSQFLTVIVNDVANDAPPVITSNGGGTIVDLSVGEGTTQVTDVNATDVDGDTEGNGLIYSLTGADAGQFNISPTGNLTFNTAPDFETPVDANGDNVYTVDVTVTDTTSLKDTQTINVTVTDVAEALPPVIISDGGGDLATVSVVEGNTAVTTVAATDGNNDTVTYTITPVTGDDSDLFEINTATGALTFKTAPDFETPLDTDGDNDYIVAVTASDPGGLTDTQIITVTVLDTTDALPPVITSNGGGDLSTVDVAEGTTAVTTVTATDGNNDPISYAIRPVAGDDSALFDIDAASGTVTFKSPPDFENPADADGNNEYVVVVEASDPGGLSDNQIITVRVTNVNELQPPVINSNGGGATADISVIENNTIVTTVSATDGDAGDTITYGIQANGGDDSAFFQINPTTGALTFIAPPDFENPADADGDNVYLVTVEARDPGGLTDTQTITVNVTNAVSVFLLGGQSNMVGQGLNADLPPDLAAPYPAVQIWQFGTQSYIDLRPGFAGGSGEGIEFGPEVTFGRAIDGQVDEEVYLIKYALGATTLAEDWDPNGTNNQHDIFVNRVNGALNNLTSQNIAFNIEGMLWMQGENDAFESEQFALDYQANLTAFIADMRGRYGATMKFSIGKIHDTLPPAGFVYQDTVRAAQEAVAAADPLTSIVNTDNFSIKPDDVHFDAQGQIDLGNAFAQAIVNT